MKTVLAKKPTQYDYIFSHLKEGSIFGALSRFFHHFIGKCCYIKPVRDEIFTYGIKYYSNVLLELWTFKTTTTKKTRNRTIQFGKDMLLSP